MFTDRLLATLVVLRFLTDPGAYRNDWGDPSLAGVPLVHCGPGLLVLAEAVGHAVGSASVSRGPAGTWPVTVASSPIPRILRYDWRMSATTRITVTLPSDQVAELRKITDNVSGYVAEAVARQIRHKLLVDELERYQRESGAFTEEELTEAWARLFGHADRTEDTAA